MRICRERAGDRRVKLRHAVLALGLAALAGGADAAAQHAPQAASSWRMPPEEAPLPVWQVSIWLVAPTFADQPAALLGIGRTAPAGGVWTGGGMLRAGVIDYGGGTQHLELEGELHLTRSWWRFDEVGGGCRIESWGDANDDLGPLLRLGFEEPFGRSAYALYGQAAWMPFGVLNDYAVE